MTDSVPASGTRRRFLSIAGSAAAGSLLQYPLTASAQTDAKRYAGTQINVACWTAPYAKWLAEYVPEFEAQTGIKVNFETAAFPIYNQRADLELSTKGSAYDVLNITFIYVARWINAGWFTPLNEFIDDQNRTPADWGKDDFLPAAVAPFRDAKKQIYGLPWLTEVSMSAASRGDLFKAAGIAMPDTFEQLGTALKTVSGRDGVKGFVAENNHGLTFIPFLMGFGGKVFRGPPDDLLPQLDSPEAIAAADYYCGLIRSYSPEGALSYNYDTALNSLIQGKVNYTVMGNVYLSRLGEADSKVAKTVRFAMCPAGPAGRFPQVASHAWGIPTGSKNKGAAWEFIRWAVSKQTANKLLTERGYTSLPRKSIIESPEFTKRMTVNGQNLGELYVRTIDAANSGYMSYRTVHVYPQLNQLFSKTIERIVTGQASAAVGMREAQATAITELRRAGVKV